ncbi:hypothetical protein SAMN06265365_11098 [Tistlia consotensis]|uniref:Uncharacterized protein n=1 Tax=Tistlia consotensis USBA 355 TaxID=560819 RepID=A0A1Y6BYS3_9PROT|nr:hypothetical protein [Tistlia consotensis]SMF27127.1 hypothetical protein SAMN05428998_10958 [Tistlia consotensis USBA 355]SNR66474.1 hypothetical protein SAMN06265365_11098 [Tistlia consotensis]
MAEPARKIELPADDAALAAAEAALREIDAAEAAEIQRIRARLEEGARKLWRDYQAFLRDGVGLQLALARSLRDQGSVSGLRTIDGILQGWEDQARAMERNAAQHREVVTAATALAREIMAEHFGRLQRAAEALTAGIASARLQVATSVEAVEGLPHILNRVVAVYPSACRDAGFRFADFKIEPYGPDFIPTVSVAVPPDVASSGTKRAAAIDSIQEQAERQDHDLAGFVAIEIVADDQHA